MRIARVHDSVALAATAADPRLFVASRRGGIFALDGSSDPVLMMNLSAEAPCCVGEGGVLGLTFSPDGNYLYVSFIDRRGRLRIAEFEFWDGRIHRRSWRNLLSVPQPSERHHGGHMAFGPDGYLWIATGDGSLGFDPMDDAQSLGSLRGKMLRLDPRPGKGRPYTIPPENPFVRRPGARPEIFAYGLRNPWRFSFDRLTGDLWIADVGQYVREEIDFVPAEGGAGANFGWNRMEGSHHLQGERPRHPVPPIAEYVHDGKRCAVIGGYVYRGTAIEGLQGAYVYGDFCDGTVRALLRRRGKVVLNRSLGIHIDTLASFGEGADGELYALSLFKGIFRVELVA